MTIAQKEKTYKKKTNTQTALENDIVSGITLWQFCDTKADDSDTVKCGQCDYYPNSNNCSYINTDCSRPGNLVFIHIFVYVFMCLYDFMSHMCSVFCSYFYPTKK